MSRQLPTLEAIVLAAIYGALCGVGFAWWMAW